MSSRYRILRPLEPGPDLRVYLAVDEWNTAQSKVLSLLPGKITSRSSLRDVERLYDIRTALVHPWLHPVQDIAFRGKRPGFICDFLTRKLIDKKGKRLKPVQAIKFSVQLAELLSFFHHRKFFCGYLRPSHLFVGKSGDLLLNLPSPKQRPAGKSLQTQAIRYASPEWIGGRTTSKKSDLYSLGMVLYRLFTGHAPFLETDSENLLRKQVLSYPVRPRRLNPDIPAKVEQLILDLIQKDPQIRPSSASHVSAALQTGDRLPAPPSPPFRCALAGREDESATLREILDLHIRNPKPRLVSIAGHSGIGKTALMERVESAARLRRAATFTVSHHAGDGALGAFQADSEPGQRWEFTDTWREARNTSQLTRCLLAFLRKASSLSPVVLCINDLQWMDKASLELYRRALRSDPISILFVANYRTDERPGHWKTLKPELERFGQLDEVRLARLSLTESERLAESLLGGPDSAGVSTIHREGTGIPLYIHESVRHMRETGQLVFRSGRWRSSPFRTKRSFLPVGASKTIADRLNRLTPKQREFLDHLALIGKPISAARFARILQTSGDSLSEEIYALERLNLAGVSGRLQAPVLSVTHEWTARTIAGRVGESPSKYRQIHKRIGSVLESRFQRSNDTLILQDLVRHYIAGHEIGKVNQYIWEALLRLCERRAYADAAGLLRRARRLGALRMDSRDRVRQGAEILFLGGSLRECRDFCLKQLDSGASQPDDRVYLLSMVGRIHIDFGNMERGMDALQEALGILEHSPTDFMKGELQGQWLDAMSRMGKLSEVRPEAARMLAQSQRKKVLAEKYYPAFASFAYANGDLDQAAHWQLASVRSAIRRHGSISPGRRITDLSVLYSDLGRFKAAGSSARYSQSLASEYGNPELATLAQKALAVHSRKLGHHKHAVRRLRDLIARNRGLNRNRHTEVELHIELTKNLNYLLDLETAVDSGVAALAGSADLAVSSYLVDATLASSWTWVLLGRPDRARETLTPLEARNPGREKGRLLLLRSRIHHDLAEYEQACHTATEAIETLAPYLAYHRVKGLLSLAESFLALGRSSGAESCIRKATDLSTEHSYLPLLATAHLLRARHLLAENSPDRARVLSLRALQLAKHMDRPGLESGLYRVRANAEVASGDLKKGIRSYSRALQILARRAVHLSADLRSSFSERFIAPVETERDRAFRRISRHPAPRYLGRLHELVSSLEESGGLAETAEAALECAAKGVPGLGANLFGREHRSRRFRLFAHCGTCVNSGRRHLLNMNNDPAFDGSLEQIHGKDGSVATRFYADGEPLALLYLEPPPQGMSEEDLDFLACIIKLLEWQFPIRTERPAERLDAPSTLILQDSRSIIGEHDSMKTLFGHIQRAARSDATVLIFGETGTGKELVAQALHDYSRRSHGPMTPVNCGALPKELIESELFGHRQGSFTGAVRDKPGLFEAASGGTLFLDEIGALSLDLQVRLLRVLQERKVRRVGETRERAVDVRIVAATNQPLEDLIEKGLFREDLYHRLNVYYLEIPPLRERPTDIPHLAQFFLDSFNRRWGTRKTLSARVRLHLTRYDYPGNVRELENILESAYHLCDETIDLPDVSSRLARPKKETSRAEMLADLVERMVDGHADFWDDVRDVYLRRDLTRDDLRQIVSLGLEACGGSYQRMVHYFGLPKEDYKKFLSFLSNHGCKVDFRPFRAQRPRPPGR